MEKTLVTAAEILKEIERSSKKSFLPIIGPVKGQHLAETIDEYRPCMVLEVGTLVGYSSILIASHLPGDGKIMTIEINPDSAKKAQENIRRVGLDNKIEVLVGNALNVIPGIKAEFDMVFIDAEKKEYMDYLRLSEPKLKKYGIVFADNVKIFADQMPDFLDYLRNSGQYSSRFIDVGFDVVEVAMKLF
jgi:predicted O-methyltransferase YrrM